MKNIVHLILQINEVKEWKIMKKTQNRNKIETKKKLKMIKYFLLIIVVYFYIVYYLFFVLVILDLSYYEQFLNYRF